MEANGAVAVPAIARGRARESGPGPSSEHLIRAVPYSPEAEIAVLGAFFVADADLSREVAESLSPDEFYRDGNRRAFAAIQRLLARGDAMDPVMLKEELEATGDLAAAGGLPFIASVLDAVPSAHGMRYHAGIVRDKAALRRLLAASQGIATLAYDAGRTPLVEVQAEAERLLAEATGEAAAGDAPHEAKAALWEVFGRLERVMEGKEEPGMETGLTDLDRKLLVRRGDLCVVGARPSMGKSGLLFSNIATHAALSKGLLTVVFGVEPKREAVMARVLASEARVNLSDALRRKSMCEDDYARLATASGYVHAAPLYVDHTPSLTVAQMRAKCRQVARKAKRPVDVIIVDFLQMMTDPRYDKEYDRVSSVTEGLKNAASEFDAYLWAASQLSRKVEDRTDKRPMMSDLRESGKVEQAADEVLLLYRPEYYFGETRTVGKKPHQHTESLTGKAEIIIGKQRDGETGHVEVFFEKRWTRFYDRTQRPGGGSW